MMRRHKSEEPHVNWKITRGATLAVGLLLGSLSHSLAMEDPAPGPANSVSELGYAVPLDGLEIIQKEPLLLIRKTTGISPEQLADETSNGIFIRESFAPMLSEAGITVLQPTNENVEVVNYLNEFIMTTNNGFGSQFRINNVAGSSHKEMVFVATSTAEIISDGILRGPLFFTNKTQHQEANMGDAGHIFNPARASSVESALRFMLERHLTDSERLAAAGIGQ